jgi:ketosteroid isomerase-like protein
MLPVMSQRFDPPTGLALADESAIRRLIDVYGHIVDSGDWHLLTAVFTDDVVFDLTPFGWGRLEGVDALIEKWHTVQHPVGHHMTNVVMIGDPDTGYGVLSKGISVLADGSSRSNEYIDRLRRTEAGWRIEHRTVLRRSPAATV